MAAPGPAKGMAAAYQVTNAKDSIGSSVNHNVVSARGRNAMRASHLRKSNI